MDDLPIGPTRHHVIVCHDGRRIDVDAEAMWPAGSCLEFWATLDVIGPRQVCVQRVAASEVSEVEREDGEIWTPWKRSLTRWTGFPGSHRRRGRSQRGSRQ